jgi:hypothetical protein
MPEDKQNSPVDAIPPLQSRLYLRDLEDFHKLPEDRQGTMTKISNQDLATYLDPQ